MRPSWLVAISHMVTNRERRLSRTRSYRDAIGDFRSDLVAAEVNGFLPCCRAILLWPGVRAVFLYRLQGWLFDSGRRRLASVVYSLNAAISGCEFVPGCRFGAGLLVRHPNGIVVGHGVVAGERCVLLHQTTIGERHVDGTGDHGYPTLEDDVVVGAKASVLGRVHIGRSARIGAHALVLEDVADNAVVAGVPARPVNGRPHGRT